MMINKRVLWVDIVKGMCMFFIIMSHSHTPKIYSYIYTPFFLSTFFFTSGYTFNQRSNFASFFLHKCKSLLIPYFCFGIINAFLAFLVDGDSFLFRLRGLLLSPKGNDDLWFIMCLFIMQCMFYFVWKLYYIVNHKSKKIIYADFIIGIVSILFSILGYEIAKHIPFGIPYQITTSAIQLPYMTFGFIWKKEDIKEIELKPLLILIVLYIVFSLTISNDISIHRDSYEYFALYIPEGLLGVYIIASLSRMIARSGEWISKALVFVGANTLVYYAFQSKFIRLLDLFISYFNVKISYYVLCPLYAVLGCFALALPAYIVKKYFPFLLGKTYNLNLK